MSAVLAIAGARTAAAHTLKGPHIATEGSQASNVVIPEDGRAGGSKETGLSVATRRTEVALLAPVPADLFGTMAVIKADLARESRIYTVDDGGGGNGDETLTADAGGDKSPDDLGFGAVILPHAKEGAPRFFVVAERYGPMSWTKKARPMAEFVIGADFDEEALPFNLRFTPADESESRVLIRMRRFPGFTRWLYLVAHRIEAANGWILDLSYPTHATLGWQTVDRGWRLYGGVRAVGREYSVELGTGTEEGASGSDDSGGIVDEKPRGWVDGHTETALVGVRRLIVKPLYVAFEVGMRREVMDVIAEDGETVSSWETKFAPWARLALETWIRGP